MRKLNWDDARELLCRHDAMPPLVEAKEFWTSFRLRAREGGPTAEAVLSRPVSRPLRLAWAAAAATAVVMGVVGLLKINSRVQVAGVASSVEDIEVLVPYSTMMIMQDSSGGAIVWVTDLDSDSDS